MQRLFLSIVHAVKYNVYLFSAIKIERKWYQNLKN